MSKFQSTKLYDGFTSVFRQWRASDTHCKYLHGYSVSFRIYFEGELDNRNWVWDFGGMKRSTNKIEGMSPKEWMQYMFDHTTIIAEDDPELESFLELDKRGVLRLRIIQQTGAERFAEYVYHKIDSFIRKETNGRVKITKVEFFENDSNSAVFIP